MCYIGGTAVEPKHWQLLLTHQHASGCYKLDVELIGFSVQDTASGPAPGGLGNMPAVDVTSSGKLTEDGGAQGDGFITISGVTISSGGSDGPLTGGVCATRMDLPVPG